MNFNFNVQLSVDEGLLRVAGCQLESLKSIASSLASIARDVRLAREKYHPVSADVADISVSQVKESSMASKYKVVCLKAPAAAPRVATKATPHLGTTFGLVDTKPGTFKTMGLDSEVPPVTVDISALATQTVVSADPNVTAVVTGMSVDLTSASGTSGTAQVTWTITANDGSFTFSFIGSVPYSGGPITGVQITQIT